MSSALVRSSISAVARPLLYTNIGHNAFGFTNEHVTQDFTEAPQQFTDPVSVSEESVDDAVQLSLNDLAANVEQLMLTNRNLAGINVNPQLIASYLTGTPLRLQAEEINVKTTFFEKLQSFFFISFTYTSNFFASGVTFILDEIKSVFDCFYSTDNDSQIIISKATIITENSQVIEPELSGVTSNPSILQSESATSQI